MKNTTDDGAGLAPMDCSACFVLDKHGREIKPGDVLKVWHFIGRRRKVNYMYKWVLREERLGKNQTPFLRVSHLSTGNVEDGYWLQKDGSKHDEYEIVAGYGGGISKDDYDPFDARPKRQPNVPSDQSPAKENLASGVTPPAARRMPQQGKLPQAGD